MKDPLFSLSEIRHGTGFHPDARFYQLDIPGPDSSLDLLAVESIINPSGGRETAPNGGFNDLE